MSKRKNAPVPRDRFAVVAEELRTLANDLSALAGTMEKEGQARLLMQHDTGANQGLGMLAAWICDGFKKAKGQGLSVDEPSQVATDYREMLRKIRAKQRAGAPEEEPKATKKKPKKPLRGNT